MSEIFKITDILVNHVKQRYPEDISIIAYYGSQATGTAHEKSDLDFFFIPANENGSQASVQFIIDGIGYDFWPVSWERAHNIATFGEGIVSVIADSKILFSKSTDDLIRFYELKAKIDDLKNPKNKKLMLNKAIEQFKNCCMYYYNMQSLNDLSSIRIEGFKLTTSIKMCLAFLNQTYYTKGWGSNIKQVFDLKLKPGNFEEILGELSTERDVKQILKTFTGLIEETRRLILSEQRKMNAEPNYSRMFKGYYEEIKSSFNKIIHACDQDDYDAVFYAGLQIQDEIGRLLAVAGKGIGYSNFNTYPEYSEFYEKFNLPDITQILDSKNLNTVKNNVKKLDRMLKELLIQKGVRINEFNNIDEFELFLNE